MTLVEAQKKVEEIRTTSTNIHEVIKRLQQLWEQLGVTVTFTKYPNLHSIEVSNSHSAPKKYKTNWSRDPLIPKGYPGWVGRWEGTIKSTDGNISFSTLRDGSKKYHIPQIHWIKTGTGSPGINFSITGELFLYDFPVMTKDAKSPYTDYASARKEYKRVLEHYYKEYRIELTNFKKEQLFLQRLKDAKEEAITLKKNIETVIKNADDFFNLEFNKQYNKQVPMPVRCFGNDKEIAEIIGETTSFKTAKTLPSLEEIHKKLHKLKKEIETIQTNHPELLI